MFEDNDFEMDYKIIRYEDLKNIINNYINIKKREFIYIFIFLNFLCFYENIFGLKHNKIFNL